DLITTFETADTAQEAELITAKANECLSTQDEKTISEILTLKKSIKSKGDIIIEHIIEEMKAHSKVVVSGTNLVIALKHLERISDHCSNIAEYVYFMVNAKIIKHDKFEDLKIDKLE
ncbi:phosphate transport system regulatory protein PhoU, partial [Flavobacterium bomense]